MYIVHGRVAYVQTQFIRNILANPSTSVGVYRVSLESCNFKTAVVNIALSEVAQPIQ